jgi:hypothetical protein
VPDANGRIRGVSIPRVPWHKEDEEPAPAVCPDCPAPAECVARVYCVAESHGLD